MAACDICSAETTVSEAMAFSVDDLQDLLQRGFGPPEKVVRMALSTGWTREQVIARWQQDLDARPQPYWLFCPACAKRAHKYIPVEAPAAEPGSESPEEDVAPDKPLAAEPSAGKAPAPEDELEEEEEFEEEPGPDGKRPRIGRPLFIGLLIGLLGGVAFSLFFLDRVVHAPPPTPTPTTRPTMTPVVLDTPTPFPTRRPWTWPSVTPRPTEPLYPPTPIPMPELAGAVLTLGDMPTGFRPLPDDRQEELGLAAEALAPDLALAQGRLRLWRGWEHPDTGELLTSFLVYPLTPAEQQAFDEGLDRADAGLAALWASLAPYGWVTPTHVAALDHIGEKGLWLTSADNAGAAAGLVLEIFVARRGPVLEFVLHGYAEDGRPALELVAPLRLLDERLAALVPPTGRPEATPTPAGRPTDLAGVALRRADLPTGFTALTEIEWAVIAAAETLSDSQRFSAAVRQNETMFIAPMATEGPRYVVAWAHYPLTALETGLLHKRWGYATPDTGAALLGIPASNWQAASLLSGLDDVGAAAIGFTGVDNRASPALRVELVQLYRGPALVTLLVSYPEGSEAPPDIVAFAQVLDNRLKEALGIP